MHFLLPHNGGRAFFYFKVGNGHHVVSLLCPLWFVYVSMCVHVCVVWSD